MRHRLEWLHTRSPLLIPALLLGGTLAVERVTFQIGKNLLPLLVEQFGTLASYLPFAMGVGSLVGCFVYLLAGTLGAGRGWALGFLGGLVLCGGLATFAPNVGVLLAATLLTGLTGYGGSVLLSSACERLATDSQRRDLSHRANALTQVSSPVLVAGATWLVSGSDWRAAMAAGAMLMPALAFAPLLGLHLGRAATTSAREGGGQLRQALGDAKQQLRDPAMVLNAVATSLTGMAIVPFSALMALAVVQDGIGIGVVAVLTLLSAPIALIGIVWERLFGGRPRAALATSYLPAFAGWLAVLVLELRGDDWPARLKIALWGLAAIGLRLAQATTAMVSRGLALSAGDGLLQPGTISLRAAIQGIPSAATGMLALLGAPWLFQLGGGLGLVAAVALVLLAVAVALMHRAHHTHATKTDHRGGDHDA